MVVSKSILCTVLYTYNRTNINNDSVCVCVCVCVQLTISLGASDRHKKMIHSIYSASITDNSMMIFVVVGSGSIPHVVVKNYNIATIYS